MAETELWLIDLDETAAALEAIEQTTPRLSEACIHRFAAMSDTAARRERRLAHIALRILLERRLGPGIRRMPFAVSAAGKPSLETGGVEFSLAHTGALALIALADAGPLGVDLERMRAVTMADARRAPIEQAAVALADGAPLAGSDRDARFLSAWVRLEAVGKAEGTGVGPLLERVRPGRPVEGLASSVVARDVPIADGLFAAVAVAPAATPPSLRRLPGTAPALSALFGPAGGTR